LPACRRLVDDGVSQVRGALNYVLILTFAVSPAAIIIPLMLNVMVVPKFKEVFAGMLSGSQLPAFTRLIFSSSHWILLAQLIVVAFTWFLLFAYIGGPRVYRWSHRLLGPIPDWIHFHLPWRRKRLQRDFSAMLAILLDAHVPEIEAVALAGQSTANSIVQRRAGKMQEQLARGVTLPEALTALDDAGELRWRLSNALRRGGGFLGALKGWHEALDSKAFQLEQTAAQLTTTAFLLFNAFIVAGIVLGMFLPLIALLNGMTLW
jgi:type II secretory pathway component PulF